MQKQKVQRMKLQHNQTVQDIAMQQVAQAQKQQAEQAGYVAAPGTCPQSSSLLQEQVEAANAAVAQLNAEKMALCNSMATHI